MVAMGQKGAGERKGKSHVCVTTKAGTYDASRGGSFKSPGSGVKKGGR